MAAFKPSYIAQRALLFVELVSQCQGEGIFFNNNEIKVYFNWFMF